MIPHGVEVFVGLEPIDLRWGFDRLAGLVAEQVGRDARSGALFAFFGKRRDGGQDPLLRRHRVLSLLQAARPGDVLRPGAAP